MNFVALSVNEKRGAAESSPELGRVLPVAVFREDTAC